MSQDRSDAMKATNVSLTPPQQDAQGSKGDYPDAPREREQVRTGSPEHLSAPGYADAGKRAPAPGGAGPVAGTRDSLDHVDEKGARQETGDPTIGSAPTPAPGSRANG